MLKKTAVNFDFAREGIIFSDHLVYSAFGSVSMRPASLGSPPVVEANEPTNLHSESRCYAAAGLLPYVPPSSVERSARLTAWAGEFCRARRGGAVGDATRLEKNKQSTNKLSPVRYHFTASKRILLYVIPSHLSPKPGFSDIALK